MEKGFNISDLFFEAARQYPHKPAIIHGRHQVSFAGLATEVEATVAYFRHIGIAPGDRVLLFVPMGIPLYRIVLALFKLGATAVFLDEWVSKERLERCCQIAQCQAFIGTTKARVLGVLSRGIRQIPIKLNSNFLPAYLRRSLPAPGPTGTPTRATDTALITFTTGSTGTPKAAKRTHGFLYEQFAALIDKIKPQADEVDLPVLPIVLLINLGAGCTSLITDFKAAKPERMQPERILAQLRQHGVSRMVASPFFLKQLASYLVQHGQEAPSSLRKIFTGGAPVFPAEAALYKRAFPAAAIEIVYGSTEAEPISSISAEALLAGSSHSLSRGLPVGFPYHKIQLRIIGITEEAIACAGAADFDKWELPQGEIGEIIVSGPHVLDAYFNNEEAIKRHKIGVDGRCWHRTGDSGYLGTDGLLYLCGRCSSLISLPDGSLLTPFTYEAYFQSIAGVQMGTILELNHQVVAVLEVLPGTPQARLAQELQQVLPELQRVLFLAPIPRDPRHHAKIDYAQLQKRLSLMR